MVCDLGKAVYGHCPVCGAPGVARERGIGGNDICERGCVYPSAKAVGGVVEPSRPSSQDGSVVHASTRGTMEAALRMYGLPERGNMPFTAFYLGVTSMVEDLVFRGFSRRRMTIFVGLAMFEWISVHGKWAGGYYPPSLCGVPIALDPVKHPWYFDVSASVEKP